MPSADEATRGADVDFRRNGLFEPVEADVRESESAMSRGARQRICDAKVEELYAVVCKSSRLVRKYRP